MPPRTKKILEKLVRELARQRQIKNKKEEKYEVLIAAILSDKNMSFSELPDWLKAYSARSSGEAEFKKLIFDRNVTRNRDWTDDDYRDYFKEKTGLTVEQLNELIISTDFFIPYCFSIYSSKHKDHLGYEHGLFDVCDSYLFEYSRSVLVPEGKQEIKTILDNSGNISFSCDSNGKCIGNEEYRSIKKHALRNNDHHLLDVAIESGYELTEDDFDTIFRGFFLETNYYAWNKLKEKFTPKRAMEKLQECLENEQRNRECLSGRQIYLFEQNRITQSKFRINEEDRQRIEQNIIKQMKEIADLKDKQNKLIEQQLRTEQKNLSDDQFRTKLQFVFAFAIFGLAIGCCSREFYRMFKSFREQFNDHLERSKQKDRRYQRLLDHMQVDFLDEMEMEDVSPNSFGRRS